MLKKYYSDCFPNKDFPGISKGESGKPYLKDKAFGFSVSHSKGLVLLAVSVGEIGADCELVRPVRERIWDYVLSDNEKRILKVSPNPTELFMEYFTFKEAFVKLSGEGFSRTLKSCTDEALRNEYPGVHSESFELSGYRITAHESMGKGLEISEMPNPE